MTDSRSYFKKKEIMIKLLLVINYFNFDKNYNIMRLMFYCHLVL